MLAVDISADAATRGQISAYRLHPFLRRRRGDHEGLLTAEGLERTHRTDGEIGWRRFSGPTPAGDSRSAADRP